MLKEKPFMATYLIDYENVKSEGIKGIAQLSEEDRVVIFIVTMQTPLLLKQWI